MWKRNSECCHCFRTGITTRGHNTNIVEVSIRTFKDLVLKRCKAFNSKFANKCTQLVATKVNDFEYTVNSALDEHMLYTVNI
ncbi:hypothetical protein NQ317_015264 [Molorchus minor]|uniref:Uncharacterized protein n=1 Tax=Molorchus minor TaxID=1323400 RepID=A0ABQ9IZ06_9CUCU|nr:hypothetical protein NQ317_015264 [Molorchus minor]